MGETAAEEDKPIWARHGCVAVQCPKSLITAQSMFYLEQFRCLKSGVISAGLETDAKTAEALLLLSEALRKEEPNVE